MRFPPPPPCKLMHIRVRELMQLRATLWKVGAQRLSEDAATDNYDLAFNKVVRVLSDAYLCLLITDR